MKILQINANYGFGSTGIIVKDLQNLCLKNGIDCEVAYATAKGPIKNAYKIGNPFFNKLHALLSRISGKQGYFSFLSTYRFLLYLNKHKVNVIHLHNLHSGYINFPMLLNYAAKHNITIIVTLHDCWFYTGGCSHYTSIGCNKWLNSCGNCPLRYRETPAYLWDSSQQILNDRKKLFSKIKNLYAIGVSQWIIDEAKQTTFKKAQCMAIHNGIDTKFFHPSASNIRQKLNLENKFVILAPSNKWFLEINQETLNYFATHITDDMCIVFFGYGCTKSTLPQKMINYGFVSSREEIRDLYSAADVMLNCTREESLSLLNLEVQACGTPVVTYSNTGVKETVNGICSFAVKDGSPKAMWEAMMDIKEKGKAFFSQSCISWINHEFNKEKNYQKYLDLYKSII